MPPPKPHYRGRNVRKLKQPPEEWSPDWMTRMDIRFRAMAIVRAHLAELENDLSAGEPERLSWSQRRLASHLVWCDTMLEEMERRFARGDEVDFGQFSSLLNTANRVGRTLGLRRAQRQVPSLAQYLEGEAA